MDKEIITFSATQQTLIKTGGIDCFAGETVKYVEARFDLGETWSGFDHIDAIWTNDGNFTQIAKTLDPQGVCIVPVEVLSSIGDVRVNLVGVTSEEDLITERLTTYPIFALGVNANVPLSGSETQPITPSQFDQFVAIVIAEVEKVTGMTAEAVTLPPGSDATAEFTNGKLILGIPQGIQGEKGDTGETGATPDIQIGSVETLPAGSPAEVTISGTPEDPILNFKLPEGDKGDTGETPDIQIGTVETLRAGSPAEVTITGTPEDPELNFKIPKGDTGEVTLEDLSSLLPTDTASGDIISIPDGQSVVPVKSLKVTLEPIQSGSGTPSPDNVRPISGHTEVVTEVCGVNVWDEEWEVGGINTSTGAKIPSSDRIRTKNFVPVIPNTTYFYKGVSGCALGYVEYDYDYNYIRGNAWRPNTTLTTQPNTFYLMWYVVPNYGTTYNHDICINYPSTDTDYHAYQGTTYTTLVRTVYGGTLNVVSGELVVDRAMVTLNGSEIWSAYSSHGFSISIPTMQSGTRQSGWSDKFKILSQSDGSLASAFGIALGLSNQTAYFCGIKNNIAEITDVPSWKAWLANNPAELVYPLATPQTYQLDPQTISLLHGNNNVWSDGEVELTYNADVQLWVLKKLGSGTRLTSVRPTLSVSQDPAEDESEDASEEEIK